MICPTCQKNSTHIRILANGNIVCHDCGNYSESGGVRTDKILTRNASRITNQAVQFEQDLITPYIIDKTTNKPTVNQDFVDLYPNQAAGTFTPEELKASGNETLTATTEADKGENIVFSGEESEAIEEIIESA